MGSRGRQDLGPGGRNSQPTVCRGHGSRDTPVTESDWTGVFVKGGNSLNPFSDTGHSLSRVGDSTLVGNPLDLTSLLRLEPVE